MKKMAVFSYMTMLVSLSAVAGHFILAYAYSSYNMLEFLIVPFFFWSLYIVAISFVKLPIDNSTLAKSFMAFKTIKMLVSLVALAVVAFVLCEHVVWIMLYFLAFSLVMLVAESAFMVLTKKQS